MNCNDTRMKGVVKQWYTLWVGTKTVECMYRELKGVLLPKLRVRIITNCSFLRKHQSSKHSGAVYISAHLYISRTKPYTYIYIYKHVYIYIFICIYLCRERHLVSAILTFSQTRVNVETKQLLVSQRHCKAVLFKQLSVNKFIEILCISFINLRKKSDEKNYVAKLTALSLKTFPFILLLLWNCFWWTNISDFMF